VHRFCNYNNIVPNAECQRVLVLALCLVVEVTELCINVCSSWQIRAQRKFASNGASPSCSTPEVKCRPPSYMPRCLFPERKVATEDFLTFLCLRGIITVLVVV